MICYPESALRKKKEVFSGKNNCVLVFFFVISEFCDYCVCMRAMFRGRDATMIILSDNDEETELIVNLETLTQAAIIFIMAIAIIVSNILIIATYVNFRSKLNTFILIYMYTCVYEALRTNEHKALSSTRNTPEPSKHLHWDLFGSIVIPFSVFRAFR